MRVFEGSALNYAGDRWAITCDCGKDIAYTGFFDPEDTATCPACGVEFRIRKLWFQDGSYTGEK